MVFCYLPPNAPTCHYIPENAPRLVYGRRRRNHRFKFQYLDDEIHRPVSMHLHVIIFQEMPLD